MENPTVRSFNGKPWARVLCYVTSRAIQNRLDEVCGKDGWSTEIKNVDGAYICKMGINVDGQWIYKEDGADETKIEATKGGISGSIKRAGVQWGIGRYLYDLGTSWAVFVSKDESWQYSYYDKNTKETYYWNPPVLPNWALPGNIQVETPEEKVEVPAEKKAPVEKIKVNPAVDYADKICGLMSKYEKQLDGAPMQLAQECIDNKGDYEAMYVRMVTYLGKKGIKVA